MSPSFIKEKWALTIDATPSSSSYCCHESIQGYYKVAAARYCCTCTNQDLSKSLTLMFQINGYTCCLLIVRKLSILPAVASWRNGGDVDRLSTY